ncbi:MAG: hypothetical protein CVU44_07050 [Chloroflexi bacterium HGW-Chloroflexi-6]|nr:MAG: hypothetical protein CVU44_07050 [Chloroflexi bacterium HGW-Chloroflexi-6]
MKILHVITSLDHGGAQTMLTELALQFQHRGVSNLIVSMTSQNAFAKQLGSQNIPVEILNMHQGRSLLTGFAKLRSLIRRFQPDIVQTWLYHADLAGGLAARLSRVPVVWGIHHTAGQNHLLKPATQAVVQINKLISGFVPSQIICCSQSAYDSHLARGFSPAKLTLAQNGVDTIRFQPNEIIRQELRTNLHIPESATIIGHCGRFHPAKGHLVFIQAASELLKLHPELHFVMCGSGIDAENQKLTHWIAPTNLRDHIHLLGPQDGLDKILPGFDIFVSSSLEEALPLTVCEAMACQVPCVVTNVGDQARIVEKTGICVIPNSASEITRGCNILLNLHQQERAFLGLSARRRIQENFSLQSTAEKYLSIYNRVIHKGVS